MATASQKSLTKRGKQITVTGFGALNQGPKHTTSLCKWFRKHMFGLPSLH